MAKAAQKFDLNAFMENNERTPKLSIAGWITDKAENIYGRSVAATARMAAVTDNTSEYWDIGRKEGELNASLKLKTYREQRMELMRQRLEAAGVECA